MTFISWGEEERAAFKDPNPSANYLYRISQNLFKHKHGHTTGGISSQNASCFPQEALVIEEESSVWECIPGSERPPTHSPPPHCWCSAHSTSFAGHHRVLQALLVQTPLMEHCVEKNPAVSRLTCNKVRKENSKAETGVTKPHSFKTTTTKKVYFFQHVK